MTGLQARHPKMPSDQDCAGKHGDDDNLVKAQVCPPPPLPSHHAMEAVLHRCL